MVKNEDHSFKSCNTGFTMYVCCDHGLIIEDTESIFIARLLAVEQMTSLLHNDQSCCLLCSAYFRGKNCIANGSGQFAYSG
jgi:hypothetical protein